MLSTEMAFERGGHEACADTIGISKRCGSHDASERVESVHRWDGEINSSSCRARFQVLRPRLISSERICSPTGAASCATTT
jgi:hypothetical protein